MSTAALLHDDDEQMWGAYREEIACRLNRDRPSRYSQADQAWMEPTIAWARAHLPADDVAVVRRVARNEVIAQERNANRKANALLKRCAAQGVLFWADLGPLPFTLDQKTGFRVRFDAASPEDFELKAQLIRESADLRRETEYAQAVVLEALAREARAAGYERVCQIGDKVPPGYTPTDDELDDDEDSWS